MEGDDGGGKMLEKRILNAESVVAGAIHSMFSMSTMTSRIGKVFLKSDVLT